MFEQKIVFIVHICTPIFVRVNLTITVSRTQESLIYTVEQVVKDRK
jgi:hypothetical protein